MTMKMKRLFSGAALLLPMMLLTSATAWADGVAFLPYIEKSDLLSDEAFEAVTFTLKKGDVIVAETLTGEGVTGHDAGGSPAAPKHHLPECEQSLRQWQWQLRRFGC